MDPPRDEEPVEGTVLDPEDLEITDEDVVEKLEESRFVIGADGRPDVSGDATSAPDLTDPLDQENPDPSGTEPEPTESRTGEELRGSDVKRWITANLERTESQYAYRLAAKTGEDISHQQLASDDIGMAFDGLLMWYAQQVGDGTAVEDTLGILLAESNIRVRFPVAGMRAYLEEHDLSPEDSIEALLETIQEQDGLVFPRGTNR